MGVDIGHAKLVLQHCAFVGNTANARGGAIAISKMSSLVLEILACTFENNHAVRRHDPRTAELAGGQAGNGLMCKQTGRQADKPNSDFSMCHHAMMHVGMGADICRDMFVCMRLRK